MSSSFNSNSANLAQTRVNYVYKHELPREAQKGQKKQDLKDYEGRRSQESRSGARYK